MVWKWGLVLLALGATASGTAVAALIAYDARPEPRIIVVAPTIPPAPTVVPFRAAGPDLSLPAAYPKPLRVSLGPRAASTAQLHLGPGDLYAVVGTLQAGAPLNVVGRDESGEWLAVVFPPNSTLRAWLPASQALEVADIEGLRVEPVRFLP